MPQFDGEPFCATAVIDGNKVKKLDEGAAGAGLSAQPRGGVHPLGARPREHLRDLGARPGAHVHLVARLQLRARRDRATSIAVFYYWLTSPERVVDTGRRRGVGAPRRRPCWASSCGRCCSGVSPTRRPRCASSRPSDCGSRCPPSPRSCSPSSKSEIFDPNGLVEQPADVFDVFGVAINGNQLAVLLSGVVVALGLTVLMRFTPFGLIGACHGRLAPHRADLRASTPPGDGRVSWMLGTRARRARGRAAEPEPILGLSEMQFTLLLVASFARRGGRAADEPAARVPRRHAHRAHPGAREGLVLPDDGVLAETASSPSIPFIVMLGVLLVYQGLGREQFEVDAAVGTRRRGGRRPRRRRAGAPRSGRSRSPSRCSRCRSWLDDFWVGVVSQGVALAVLFLTFTVVTGEGGHALAVSGDARRHRRVHGGQAGHGVGVAGRAGDPRGRGRRGADRAARRRAEPPPRRSLPRARRRSRSPCW